MSRNPVPTVAEQTRDRATQRDRLRDFFRAHPDVAWTQETLAEACGCALSTVRTRISELVLEHAPLRWHQSGWRDAQGQAHTALKSWEWVTRPDSALGRDAADVVPAPLPLFDGAVTRTTTRAVANPNEHCR